MFWRKQAGRQRAGEWSLSDHEVRQIPSGAGVLWAEAEEEREPACAHAEDMQVRRGWWAQVAELVDQSQELILCLSAKERY